ncbi:RNA-guided endonuclease TnpB family protein [Clostridium sp. WILCCON 0269]|uniref:RNA-guided endonuclease TnpB family protein n=1 Tax=Candidatus Clostridium eludens TaxID=3381663 RepID=A0ABW8SR82_9CLOT
MKDGVRINKCISVIIKNCNELEYKTMNKTLRDIQYLTCKASNRAMQMYYTWEYERIRYKNKYGEYPNEQEKFGKTYRNVVEGEMKVIMSTINAANVGQTNAFVMKKWNTDKNDILNYRKSVANFKLDMPIYLKNSNYKIYQGNHGFEITCSLFSKKYQNENDIKQVTFTTDKLDGNKKATLNKIINKEYKQGSAQIEISKKGKIKLTISFSFKPKKSTLDKNRILGVDLGLVNVATLAIWDNDTQNWDYINYKHNILSGQELIRFRQKLFNMQMSEKNVQKEIQKYNEQLHQKQLNKFEIGSINGLGLVKFRDTTEKHKKELSIASKCVGTGRIGHGYKSRMKPVNKMRDKVSRFADTFNHKYSRYIVDFSIKNNCGVIQMEDLSGSTQNTQKKFLKDWSYYDLQQKIKYKAEEHGIEVSFVDPKYTSLRCSFCGNILKENRDCKNNQAKFECAICGHKENAVILVI